MKWGAGTAKQNAVVGALFGFERYRKDIGHDKVAK